MTTTAHSSSALSFLFSSTSVGLALASCALIGFIAGRVLSIDHETLTIIPDSNQHISTVQIDGITNGELRGTVQGNVRLSANGMLITPNSSGSFVIADTSVLTNKIEIHIPEGMQFVASSKGKKYYSINSKSGQNLSPSNRIYFKDAESAEKAGYTR